MLRNVGPCRKPHRDRSSDRNNAQKSCNDFVSLLSHYSSQLFSWESDVPLMGKWKVIPPLVDKASRRKHGVHFFWQVLLMENPGYAAMFLAIKLHL